MEGGGTWVCDCSLIRILRGFLLLGEDRSPDHAPSPCRLGNSYPLVRCYGS
jgi:hypothetical protein